MRRESNGTNGKADVSGGVEAMSCNRFEGYERFAVEKTGHKKKIFVLLTVLAVSVGCDQATKYWARILLGGHETISCLGGLFRLQYIENTGAFLGLGGHLPGHFRFALLIGFVSFFLLGLMVYLLASRKLTPFSLAPGALILGGGLSNLIDRLLNQGSVVDFMHIGIGPLRTGVFNVADLAAMAGVVLFAFSLKRQKNI